MRLGFPEPDLVAIAATRSVTLRHLALAVILLRSRPVSLDELVETIGALGSRGSGPRLRTSIVKSLAAATALVRLPDGRYDVDLTDSDWSWFRFVVFPQPPSADPLRAPAPAASPSAAAPAPDPDVPLSLAELDEAFTEDAARRLPVTARVVIALDVTGRPVSGEELESFLSARTGASGFWSLSSLRFLTSPFLRRRPDGRLEFRDAATLTPAARDALRRARARVREGLAVARARRAQDARFDELQAKWRAEDRRRVVEAQCARRALVHAFQLEGKVVAATVLDATTRTTTTYVGEPEVAGLPALLGSYDVLIGLDLRAVLAALGQLNAPAARVVDLASTPRSRRIGRRLVKLTTADWLEGSLGPGAALEDPARAARDYVGGNRKRFVERLERDAKTLFAFYRFGVVQRGVRLVVRGDDEFAGVDWAEAGDATIRGYVADLEKDGAPIEIVVGAVPAFEDPWARAALLRGGPEGLVIEPRRGPLVVRGSLTLSDVLDARRI
jgi:hypothetical protein